MPATLSNSVTGHAHAGGGPSGRRSGRATELTLQTGDRPGRADVGRLVAGELAQAGGEEVGRSVDGLGDRTRRVRQCGGDLFHRLALQDLRVVLREHAVLTAEVDVG